MPLLLEIITPEGTLLSQEVDAVTLPTATGELTLLPGHQPLLGQTQTGEMLYKASALSVTSIRGEHKQEVAQSSYSYIISTGFFMLRGDKLSLLVEGAADTANIDLEAIKAAQERAQTALKENKNLDAADVEEFERVIRFSMAQRIARERR